jgi:rhodanese-related sulfurtransferase
MPHTIDINELNRILADGEALTLLDVRRKTDYEATPQKIKGATWCDPEKIDTWTKQLPAAQRLVVYCVKGGSVSQSVTERLRQQGFDTLFLEGGLKKWIECGHPVE